MLELWVRIPFMQQILKSRIMNQTRYFRYFQQEIDEIIVIKENASIDEFYIYAYNHILEEKPETIMFWDNTTFGYIGYN